ncbi:MULTISPECIES: hypothetical protein [Lysinibacillus]|uniref:hypothetical protein n=1 Tax=Lysinibacillus TaxID=400634 RepID=UPI00214B90A8|nr:MULTISPECIES: hypothetical protein [Lysinibacillus]UNT57343.1 hypothetical protein ICJ70_10085 [Lysinibacillus capsici]UUV27377.1 hypothetical protein NP781_12845 [Lysinibacillus sp. FN11]UYB45651.1 hypothetical protein OCI51_15480 [Lysinibacillus capsici]WHP42309.1 hypothetical protein QIX46_04625 [Lysinibacillus boronitolerans]
MKKYLILYFITILSISLISGCSSNKNETIKIYESVDFSEIKKDSMKKITELEDIELFSTAFNSASKNQGIKDMASPNYKVKLGKKTFYLWINNDSGVIMDASDTHTTYSINENLVKDINEVINNLYMNKE